MGNSFCEVDILGILSNITGLLSSVMSLWHPGLQSARLLCLWDFPGKNNGVGCQFLLQWIFPTQGLNPHLLHLMHWFSSVAQLCPTLCDPMNCSTPGLPVHHQLLEFTQTHVHQVGDAIQPSHPLSSPSPPAPNPSQHQGLFLWVNSLHEVDKVLEFQLQHQSFQWTPRTDLL